MADPELVKTLDYIMNRCDEAAIEAVAAAVVRRRRDLALFGGRDKLPDPKKWAQDITSQMNIGASIDGVKSMVRNMAVEIIKQHAPELTAGQIAELTDAWIPSGGEEAAPPGMNADLLETMAAQFAAFSQGRMSRQEDQSLRDQLGAWPDRYWKAFPPVVKLVIRDYLKGEFGEQEFQDKLRTALSMQGI
ncbi:MAG: hypothetical protein LBP76_01830 [Treponema sp.]|jgi:hypothetical protein|nr:hypothetical protein [Treponema sp.]